MATSVDLGNFEGYKPGMSSSVGSAEDDSMSMSGSDVSSPGTVDLGGQTAQILFQYDAATGTFTEPGLTKPIPLNRLTMKRPYTGSCSSGYASETLLEANPAIIRAIGSLNTHTQSRRQRSEKKPIPAEQKDDKYFERRRRNNHAAKKSRDTRKAREDHVAIRASYLEKENAVLKAQLTTLRDEAENLKQLLLMKRQQHSQQQQQQAALRQFMTLTSLPAHIQV